MYLFESHAPDVWLQMNYGENLRGYEDGAFTTSDQPPVPLLATLLATSGSRVLIEWTDPSGTLNPDPEYPLNVWMTAGAWNRDKPPQFAEIPTKTVS